MPLTYAANAITINGPSGVAANERARIMGLSISHGENWGTATILFPGLYAAAANVRGKAVTIKVAGRPIFRGTVTGDTDSIGRGADDLLAVVCDLRWDMARMKVGQYGIGDLDPTWGGFTGVGYRIHFNPAGRGNRSATATDGVYTFAAGPTASQWTRRQILEFLLHWYYPTLLVPESLPAAWAEIENDLYCHLKPLPAVLTDLAARAGCSWALTYGESEEDGETASFAAISSTPATTVALDLPAATAGAKASDSSPSSIMDLQVERSIMDACDIVEIHTAPTIVETVHSNYGADPLLIASYPDVPTGYVAALRVDVTKYATHHLGASYPANTKPKRWARVLGTRANEFATGYLSDQAALKAGAGSPLRPEDCCWVAFETPADPASRYRVFSGVQIVHDQGLILIGQRLEYDGGSYEFLEGASPTIYLWITLPTIIERNYIYRSATPTTWHVDEDHPIVHAVQRTDFQPIERYQSWVPASQDPEAVELEDKTSVIEILEPDAPALYVNIQPEMQLVHDAIRDLRSRQEVTLRAILLGMPALALGDKVTIAPADARLTGREVVVGLDYNLDRDELRLTATSNLARLVTNDL